MGCQQLPAPTYPRAHQPQHVFSERSHAAVSLLWLVW
jgi:hypothetical protein